MFRLEYLKLRSHPQLGNLELNLIEEAEKAPTKDPYTSVIIGPNGTGKSYILRTIAEIFRQFNLYQISEDKAFNLPFESHCRYRIGPNVYEIFTIRLNRNERLSRKQYRFYRNRPMSILLAEVPINELDFEAFEIPVADLEFPGKVLVNAIIPTDRFVWQSSNPSDFYQYLGARNTSSSFSTRSTSRRTVKHLFNATQNNVRFKQNLADLLGFLKFETSFEVHYTTKIHKLFFSGELEGSNFRKYFEEWWDPNFTYTTRKKENPLWSIPYYNAHFGNDHSKINDLVVYLNNLVKNRNLLKTIPSSSSKRLQINLFDESITEYDLEQVRHLESLDIINLDGIKITKTNSNLSIDDVSSGEYHLLVSMISMLANMENNSLILIDEPEISLHPNWQMNYVSFLKKVFCTFNNSHFVLTTHSHFLISDLAGESSSVITLQRDPETNQIISTLKTGDNTFGWSAEEVLYTVFNVRSSRNSFLEYDLTKVVTMVNRQSDDYPEIRRILEKMKTLQLDDADPLRVLIEKTENYLTQHNA